jgi:hypothetical protein
MFKPAHLRRHERLPLVVRVRFRLIDLPDRLEHEPVDSLAIDLCEGGLFLRAPLAARLPRDLHVELDIDAGRHGRVSATARVAHHRGDGCGVRFDALDHKTICCLVSMLTAGRRHLWAQSLARAQRHLTQKTSLV